jgi:DNA mismatch repair protein MutL
VERDALVRQVLERDDIKYCPHGRPVCITLTKSQLERQFKR